MKKSKKVAQRACHAYDLTRVLKRPDRAVRRLISHCDSLSGNFDLLASRSDPARIGAGDIIAVAMLGAPISAASAAWLLGDEGQWLTTEILADVPYGAELWCGDATPILRAGDLFRLLRRNNSAALTRSAATRLLAAKRATLVPIDDSVARRKLGYNKNDNWWQGWRSSLTPELLASIEYLQQTAAEERPDFPKLSALRVVDTVMRTR